MALSVAEFESRMPDGRELYSDEPEMESTLHWEQLALLVDCLEWWWRDRNDFFIGANLTVYYSRDQLRHREFRGPDFFLVRDTECGPRRSWVVWEEGGRYPDLIIELLSADTARVDRGEKKRLYQDAFRTPEYFWFSPHTLEFAGFRLAGKTYREIPADPRGWRFSEELGLYLGVAGGRLRFFTVDGRLLPSSAEAADEEHARAEQEREQAQQEREQAQQERARAEREREHAERECARAERERDHAERERARAERERDQAEREHARAEQEREHAEQEHERAERLAQRLRAAGIEPDEPA
jgi:Uma2 family endonuclease